MRPRRKHPISSSWKSLKAHLFCSVREISMSTRIRENEKVELRTLTEFITAYSTDADCPTAFTFVEKPNTRYKIKCDGVSISASPLTCTLQQIAPTSLYPYSVQLCHFSPIVSPPGEHGMYDSVNSGFHCPHMSGDNYATVKDCCFCVQNRTNVELQRQLKLLFPEGPLEYIGVDILRPLLKSKERNQFLFMRTVGYAKLKMAIQTSTINVNRVAHISLEHWMEHTVFRLSNLPTTVLNSCRTSLWRSVALWEK